MRLSPPDLDQCHVNSVAPPDVYKLMKFCRNHNSIVGHRVDRGGKGVGLYWTV